MLSFGFAMMISVYKNAEGKKSDFFRFKNDAKNGHFCSCLNLKGGILQKALTFCIFWTSQFEGHSTRCSQLTVKTMLA